MTSTDKAVAVVDALDPPSRAQRLARALRAAMKDDGLESIVIEFDGSGDSGSVTGAEGEPATKWNPERVITTLSDADADVNDKGKVVTVLAVAEALACEVLEQRHPGWEINEGACGEVTITPDTISMHFGQRVESVEYEEYDFEED